MKRSLPSALIVSKMIVMGKIQGCLIVVLFTQKVTALREASYEQTMKINFATHQTNTDSGSSFRLVP